MNDQEMKKSCDINIILLIIISIVAFFFLTALKMQLSEEKRIDAPDPGKPQITEQSDAEKMTTCQDQQNKKVDVEPK